MATPPSRAQRTGALALLLVSLALFVAQCAGNPRIAFLRLDDPAAWISFPAPPDGMLGVAERDAIPATTFARSFDIDPDTRPSLELRAMRDFEVWLDDVQLEVPGVDHWRTWQTIALPDPLTAGHHTLRVAVRNDIGPALLAARLRLGPVVLHSDERWRVTSAEGTTRAALRVGTERRNPNAFLMPSVAEGLMARGAALVLVFALSGAVFLGLRGRSLGRAAVWGVPVVLVGLWLGPLASNALTLPNHVGFDARHHVAYVDFLREHHALPRPQDGWSMFHPPAYYLATAVAVEVGERLGTHPALGWKLVGLLAGLASALCAAQIGRSLFAATSREAWATALLAASLPMNAYISSYVTNEAMSAALATALVAATVRILLAPETSWAGLAGWLTLAAAGVLTKYTAWIVVCIAGLFLTLKWWRIERAPARRIALRLGTLALGLALAAAWFHVRAFAATGQIFPLNTDLPSATQVWWSQPGYTTAAFFTRFGEVFGHPFLAGTHSAWDAVYSTLWGDGQLAGEMVAAARHAVWDWELMAASYALALPATLLCAVGSVRAVRHALRSADPGRRAAFAFLLSFSWVLLGSVLFMTLRQPDYGLAKAFYGLAGVGPLAVFFGLGLGACDAWLASRAPTAGRAVLYGWLGAFCFASLGPYLL